MMGTGMDSFELCACSRWGTAYRKATGRGTAWKFKMPDYDSSVILKRMPGQIVEHVRGSLTGKALL